jgi:glutathione S-transferase
LQEALLCFLIWVERCEAQIGGVLDVLETGRAAVAAPFWFGECVGHADIAVACTLRFAGEAHPGLFGEAHYPALAAHGAVRSAAAVSGDRAEAEPAERMR